MMSVLHGCIILIISATGGWMMAEFFLFFLFKPYKTQKIWGIAFSGLLPSLQPKLSKAASALVTDRYVNPGKLETKFTDPLLIEQIRPEIEGHVDRFLAVKLPEIFPLLAKMMGEKTLSKFKEAFLAEVEIIFPALVKSFGQKLFLENASQEIENVINDISIQSLRKYMYKNASFQIYKFKIIGLLCGIFTGILQIVLIHIFF